MTNLPADLIPTADMDAYLKEATRYVSYEREVRVRRARIEALQGIENLLQHGDFTMWMSMGLAYILEQDDNVMATTRETRYGDVDEALVRHEAWKVRAVAHTKSESYEDGLDDETQRLVDRWITTSPMVIWQYREKTQDAAMDAMRDELVKMALGDQSVGRSIVNITEKTFEKLMKAWVEANEAE